MEIRDTISAWERVMISRGNERPTSIDYIAKIFDKFLELHGDRMYRDDGAIVGGIGVINGEYVTVIGQQKGRNLKQNMKRNFGMANPDGYRKALRLMKQAEKFGRPVICFIDTPGAFCGIEAEERGQGEAIAKNLFEMSSLKVPVLAVMIGEGGSGGALGIAVANEIWMLENSTYSILSPEGFSSILWKDSKRADEAAELMKMTAKDLKDLKIIESIIEEAVDVNEEHNVPRDVEMEWDNDSFINRELLSTENMNSTAEELRNRIIKFITSYQGKSGDEIAEERYQRFRRM